MKVLRFTFFIFTTRGNYRWSFSYCVTHCIMANPPRYEQFAIDPGGHQSSIIRGSSVSKHGSALRRLAPHANSTGGWFLPKKGEHVRFNKHPAFFIWLSIINSIEVSNHHYIVQLKHIHMGISRWKCAKLCGDIERMSRAIEKHRSNQLLFEVNIKDFTYISHLHSYTVYRPMWPIILVFSRVRARVCWPVSLSIYLYWNWKHLLQMLILTLQFKI